MVFLCDRVLVVTSARVGTWKMDFFFHRVPCCIVVRIVLVTGGYMWCERLLVVDIGVVLSQCRFMWSLSTSALLLFFLSTVLVEMLLFDSVMSEIVHFFSLWN